MRQNIILEQSDVIKIVAEKFSVNPKDISVKIIDQCYGYGLNEHYEKEFEVIVNKQHKDVNKNIPSCYLQDIIRKG